MNYYHDIPGRVDFANVYDLMIAESDDDLRFVEVGVLFGCSAAYMMDLITKSGKTIKLELVDNFNMRVCPEYFSKEAKSTFAKYAGHRGAFDHYMRTGGYSGRFSLHAKDSTEAAEDFANNSLDFVFLDGGHSYAQIKKDVLAYIPKMKKGATIGGHDYDPMTKGVERAVLEIFGRVSFVPPRSWLKKLP